MHSRSRSRRRARGDGTRGPRTSSCSPTPLPTPLASAHDQKPSTGGWSSSASRVSMACAYNSAVSLSSIFKVVVAALLLTCTPTSPPGQVRNVTTASYSPPMQCAERHLYAPLVCSAFDGTKGFPGEGPSSSSGGSDSEGAMEEMMLARRQVVARPPAPLALAVMQELAASEPSSSPSIRGHSDRECESYSGEPSAMIDESDEDTVQTPGADMREQMRLRAREDGRKSRTGTYNRDGAAKRKSHAQYAYEHFSLVQQYSIGRPCTSMCAFGQKCGENVTPKTLLACHQYSFGTNTSRQQCLGEDGEETYSYHCELLSSETQAKWRGLFAGFITHSAQDPSIRVERFMVDGIGPVCPEYCGAAYGMTTGRSSQWTLGNMLTRARSGELDHESVVAMAALNQPSIPQESTHTRTHVHAHAHAHAHAPTRTHAHPRSPPCTHTRTHAHPRTPTRTHAHPSAPTHAHTCTHAPCTHTPNTAHHRSPPPTTTHTRPHQPTNAHHRQPTPSTTHHHPLPSTTAPTTAHHTLTHTRRRVDTRTRWRSALSGG